MKPVDRQKLCPNCDGRISYEAVQCPYCFIVLQADGSANKPFNAATTQDTLSPIYQPNYMSKSIPSESLDHLTKPLYPHERDPTLEKNKITDEGGFAPVLLMTVAGNLFTLGLLQFLFSEQGVIQLEINGNYWFLMVLVSLPLFYLGFRQLSKN